MSEGMDPTESSAHEGTPENQAAPEGEQGGDAAKHAQGLRKLASRLAPPPIAPRPTKARISQAELLPPPPGVKLRPAPRRHFPEWGQAVQQTPPASADAAIKQSGAPLAEPPKRTEALDDSESSASEHYDPVADGYTQEEIEQAYAELAAEQASQSGSHAQAHDEQDEQGPLAEEQDPRAKGQDPAQAQRSQRAKKAATATKHPTFSSSTETEKLPNGSSRKLIFAVIGIALLAGLSWWQLNAGARENHDGASKETAPTPDEKPAH